MIIKWDALPEKMKNESVRKYYDILHKKRLSLVCKRIFDIVAAIFLLILFSPLFIIISIAIKIDSGGPVIFRQVRVTQYGKRFMIFKFRTMVNDADKTDKKLTLKNDPRITRVGRFLRKYRLDEIPQLFNIINGTMSFVGPRPEVEKYVQHYSDEMMATLLVPAGVTSEASIRYKDEEQLLVNAENADEIYIQKILPKKMKCNLKSVAEFSFFNELKIILRTVFAVIKRGSIEIDDNRRRSIEVN